MNASPDKEPIVRVVDIRKAFGSTQALSGVDLELPLIR